MDGYSCLPDSRPDRADQAVSFTQGLSYLALHRIRHS